MTDNGHLIWTNDKRLLSDLIPWPRNPRQVKVEQVKRLQESLTEFGQPETIAIGPGNELYNGHQRLKSWADKFGDIEVDVRIASRELTEKEREKLTIFLHKGAAGEWDFDTLANEFDVDDLLNWGFDDNELDLDMWGVEPEPDPGAQIDRAEELREQWGVETGQLWRLGEHRLIVGDCTDAEVVDRVMEGEKAFLIVTSPPYSGAEMWKEQEAELQELTKNVIGRLKNVILTGGVVAWNTAEMPKGSDGFSCNVAHDTVEFLNNGWVKRGELIWKKPMTYLPVATFTRRPTVPNTLHEHILIFFEGQRKQRDKKGQLNDEELKWNRESIWEFSPESAKRIGHIAPFPVELPTRCITLWSLPDDFVYDPFLGSGTTLIVCERLGRKCRAVEISPAYCAVTIQRWADMTGGEPELVT